LYLLRSDLPLRVTLDMLPAGVMHTYGDWRVYIGGKDADGSLHDIVVLSDDGDGVTMTHAERARLLREADGSVLEMQNVYRIPPGLQQTWRTNPLRLTVPGLEERDQSGALGAESMGGLFALQGRLAAQEALAPTLASQVALAKVQLEIAERLSFPLMCLAVSFVGAPLGARTRRSGRSYTFASGFAIVAVYFILRKAVEPLTFAAGLGGTIALCQLPNLLLCAVGAALLWRVDRI
jgi:lipopolysaccharide export LptBFGC system permease protein LptF